MDLYRSTDGGWADGGVGDVALTNHSHLRSESRIAHSLVQLERSICSVLLSFCKCHALAGYCRDGNVLLLLVLQMLVLFRVPILR
jgi:hypothetical protein